MEVPKHNDYRMTLDADASTVNHCNSNVQNNFTAHVSMQLKRGWKTFNGISMSFSAMCRVTIYTLTSQWPFPTEFFTIFPWSNEPVLFIKSNSLYVCEHIQGIWLSFFIALNVTQNSKSNSQEDTKTDIQLETRTRKLKKNRSNFMHIQVG